MIWWSLWWWWSLRCWWSLWYDEVYDGDDDDGSYNLSYNFVIKFKCIYNCTSLITIYIYL